MPNPHTNRFLLIFLITLCSTVGMLAVLIRGKDAVAGITYLDSQAQQIDLSSSGINFGIYDPDSNFADQNFVAIDHYFLTWHQPDENQLSLWFTQSNTRNRWLLLTIEPDPIDQQPTGTPFLHAISSGSYDQTTIDLCRSIGKPHSPVFIRWGHEMENVTGRYPWAQTNGPAYISAYRHFVTLCRREINTAYFVWSPAGNKGLAGYWPGNDYVDYVGLSVYGFPAYDRAVYKQLRSFSQNFSEKYERVKIYHKPIMIAELGITGQPDYQSSWLFDAIQTINTGVFPLLKTVAYFNAQDSPQAWGPNYPVPDWRIKPDLFVN